MESIHQNKFGLVMSLVFKMFQKNNWWWAATGTPASQTVSGEQGVTPTILSFVNGVGLVCPPMVIHKGQHVQQYWTNEAPVGWHIAATTKGYITQHKFHEYGICFVCFLKTHNLLD